MSTEYEFHEVANIFPLMGDAELNELVEDIKQNGLLEPIWLHDGKIIDGRNRFYACQKAKVEPTFREWDGEGSLVSFVVSLNLHRRHLDQSQKAMIGRKLKAPLHDEAKKRQATSTGGTTPQLVENLPQAEKGKARDQAAALVGVSGRLIDMADKVVNQVVPELAKAVEEKILPVSTAAKIATLPQEEQRQLIEQGPQVVRKKAKDITESAKKQSTIIEEVGPKGEIIRRVTDALGFATIAISHLERIRPDDPKRVEALTEVADWIKAHI